MVAGMFSNGAREVAQPRTIEAFEGMMKDLLKEAKNYKSPFVATKKEVVIHNPSKNPFAPLYRPDKEVVFKMDKYHMAEPPRNIYKEEPPQKIFAAAGGSVPPPNDNPSNFNKNLKKSLADYNNKISKNNYDFYKK